MKKLGHLWGIAILISFIIIGQAFGATYDLRFLVVTMDYVNYQVMVQIKASSPFNLSDGNLVFTYNSAALTYTSFTPQNFSGGAYKPMTKSGPIGTVSLNIVWGEVNPATTVTTAWMDVALVSFSITDVNNSSNLQWNTSVTDIFDDSFVRQTQGVLSNLDTTLPVELALFQAENYNGKVRLRWITQSERNNVGFNIHRSTSLNGKYEKINGKIIQGAGNSTTTIEYSFIDDRVEVNRRYYYKLEDFNTDGQRGFHGPIEVTVEEVQLPDDFYLQQNFPNPFNQHTTIFYGLPDVTPVKIQIYNLRGELIRTLVNETQQAGHLRINWDGTSDKGLVVPSGIYIYRIEAGSYREAKKMLFAK